MQQLFTLLFCLSVSLSYAQSVEVDHLSGRPQVSIPIWTLQENDLSHTIAISYSTAGMKANQMSGKVGLGWTLSAGGSVYRNLRGLPDDYRGTTSTDRRLGWLYTGQSNQIQNFVQKGDTNYETQTDEQNDALFLNTFGGFGGSGNILDTEPDFFSVDAPGIRASFMFNGDGSIVTFSPEFLQIEAVFAEGGAISSFVITSNGGTKYYFQKKENATQSAVSTGTVTHFLREFNMYKDAMTYGLEWQLTRILSLSGAEILFNYSQDFFGGIARQGISKKQYKFSFNGPTGIRYDRSQFEVSREYKPSVLSSVTTSNARIDFASGMHMISDFTDAEWDQIDGTPVLETVSVYNISNGSERLVREFAFTYEYLKNAEDNKYSYTFLKSFTERNDAITQPPYRFKYFGQSILPAVQTTRTDVFGYFNNVADARPPQIYIYPHQTGVNKFRIQPILASSDVVVLEGKEGKENHVYMQAGVLSTIEYPTGGSVRIDYEPNRFYDPVGGGEFYGGGLRVKKLTKSDGLGLANDNSEYYIYTLNGQNEGRSSAVLLNRPEYIVNTEMYYNPDGTYERYSTFSNLTGLQLWRRLIVRSFEDLQSEEKSLTIGYQKVTVREQGKGHTEFVYKIPAKYGDESAPNWSATKSFIAREMPSRQSGTFLALAPTPITYSMPFGYQLIVGQQHGLLESVKSYSEAGNLVKSATYRYIEKGAPVFVKGLKLSQIKVPFSFVEPFNGSTVISSENAYRYNHYAIRYGTVIRIEEEQEVLYDPVNAANSNLTTKRSFYEGANHNFVTREELINDQGTYRTYYKYADDLAYAAPAADVYTQNLKRLLSLNYRGALVESYSSMQVGGLSAKVVSGNVLLYKQLPSTQMVVDQVLSLKQFPLSSYTPAAITISNNQAKLNYDTQYKTEQRFESFDPLGNPINILGSDRIWRGAVRSYNYQVPVLDFSGVKAEELRYDDFESDYLNVGLIPDKRWYANPAMFTTGRFGGRAIYFENNTASVPKADQTLSRSFTKRENLYHFAAWIKSTSTGNFTLAFSTSAGSSSVIVNFPNTDNEWALLRENISITPAGPTINLKLTSTGNVALDDVLLIPRSADYIQRTYDMPHGPAAVTDHNSKTSYFEYDELGRPVITRNDNKEIVATQSYKTPRVTGEWDPDFTVTNAYVDEQTVFSAVPKFDDAQYYWSINGSEVSGVDIYKYTFKTSGSHKVQLRMVRGAVTKYSLEKVINLTYQPLKVQLCVDGPVVYDKCKNEALVLSACGSGAGSTGPATTFIASFSGTSQAVGYEWWIKHEYDIYWTKIDGASSSTYQTFRNSSFQIRCTVRDSNVKGTSLPENVKVVGDTPCTEQ